MQLNEAMKVVTYRYRCQFDTDHDGGGADLSRDGRLLALAEVERRG